MAERVVDFFAHFVKSKELLVFLVSMLPVVELRGAIPLGVFSFGFPLIKSLILSLAGNLLVTVPLVFLIDLAEKSFKKFSFLDNLLKKLLDKAKSKAQKVQKYKSLGLFIFVAIPLPGTGAWTGALIAYLLAMDKWVAFLSISLGVIVAGLLVTFFTLFGLVKGILLAVAVLFLLDKVLSTVLDKIYKMG